MNDFRAPVEIDVPLALARWQPVDAPVVSVYADWRVSGRGLHEAPTIVEKHLHEALASLPARGQAHASLTTDAARILTHLAERVDPAARGVVIFACADRSLWYAH